jgi:hypothetical protein
MEDVFLFLRHFPFLFDGQFLIAFFTGANAPDTNDAYEWDGENLTHVERQTYFERVPGLPWYIQSENGT